MTKTVAVPLAALMAVTLSARCLRCGRPLNDAWSISRGLGPHCLDKVDPRWAEAVERRLMQAIWVRFRGQ